MVQRLLTVYRLSCAVLLGGQLFFAGIAAQVVFSAEVAALPRDDARRRSAADAIGAMLARLDGATLLLCAVATACAFALARRPDAPGRAPGSRPSRRLSLWPILAGLLAAVSAFAVTPAIHAARVAGETGTPRFGMLHAVSSILLLVQMILLAVAAVISSGSRLTPAASLSTPGPPGG